MQIIFLNQAQSKTNYWISCNLMIVCLKPISEIYFLFSVNINTSLKLLWALTAQKMKFSIKHFSSKCDQIRSFLWHLGNQRLLGHSVGTSEYSEGAQRTLGYWGTKGTQTLEHLAHLGTWELTHLGTQTPGHLGHIDTWALEALYLADS